jgi:hypothetical protein
MRKQRYAAALAALLASAAPSLAQTSPETGSGGGTATIGVGVRSCARFLNDIRQSGTAEDQYFTWAEGYMSALANFEITGHPDLSRVPGPAVGVLQRDLAAFSVEEQKKRIRQSCEQNGRQSYDFVLWQLYSSLPAHWVQ